MKTIRQWARKWAQRILCDILELHGPARFSDGNEYCDWCGAWIAEDSFYEGA